MTIDCAVIGDSIAAGVARYLPQCEVRAKVGISARAFWVGIQTTQTRNRTIVISLGVNDGDDPTQALNALRRSFAPQQQVIWIVPSRAPLAARAIRDVAFRFGDRTITTALISPDGLHPTERGYQHLAEQVR